MVAYLNMALEEGDTSAIFANRESFFRHCAKSGKSSWSVV